MLGTLLYDYLFEKKSAALPDNPVSPEAVVKPIELSSCGDLECGAWHE